MCFVSPTRLINADIIPTAEIGAVLLVQANRSTILSYFATFSIDVAVGYENAGGGSGFLPQMGLRVVWS